MKYFVSWFQFLTSLQLLSLSWLQLLVSYELANRMKDGEPHLFQILAFSCQRLSVQLQDNIRNTGWTGLIISQINSEKCMHSRYPPNTPGIKNSWWITRSCSTPRWSSDQICWWYLGGMIAPFAGIGVERKGKAAQPVLPRIHPPTWFEFSTQNISTPKHRMLKVHMTPFHIWLQPAYTSRVEIIFVFKIIIICAPSLRGDQIVWDTWW